MARFEITYHLAVTKIVEADSWEDADENKYDDVPYPDVHENARLGVTGADVSSATVEGQLDEEEDAEPASQPSSADADAEGRGWA